MIEFLGNSRVDGKPIYKIPKKYFNFINLIDDAEYVSTIEDNFNFTNKNITYIFIRTSKDFTTITKILQLAQRKQKLERILQYENL